jgi:hypothetical protein
MIGNICVNSRYLVLPRIPDLPPDKEEPDQKPLPETEEPEREPEPEPVASKSNNY